MSSRSLDDLVPTVKEKAVAFQKACRDAGIEVLIYCTLRDYDEQNALYTQGRTTKGPNPTAKRPLVNIVTCAKAGESWHNFGRAFDFVPIVHGKPAWNSASLYATCGSIAENVGLEWAGRWTGPLREMAHCQDRGGMTLAEARSERARA